VSPPCRESGDWQRILYGRTAPAILSVSRGISVTSSGGADAIGRTFRSSYGKAPIVEIEGKGNFAYAQAALHFTLYRLVKKVIRFIFLFCIIFVIGTDIAAADPFKIRFMGALPEGSAFTQIAREFRSNANDRFGDRAVIDITNSANSAEALVKLQQGETDLALVPTTALITFSKNENFGIFDLHLPFVFNNLREAQSVEQSPLGVELIAALTTPDVLGLAFWNGGMTKFSGRPITSSASLKDLKLQSTTSPTVRASTERLGIVVTPLPAAQVAFSMQSHAIDAAELPPHYVTLPGE
jgi:TRAP-type C4-dicarboxylate transport system substrate-binding protein